MRGYKKQIGIGEETAIGTRVDPTMFLLTDEEDMSVEDEEIVDESLNGLGGMLGSYKGTRAISGTLGDFNLYPKGALWLLILAAMGKVETETIEAGEVFKHTITLKDDTPYGESKGLTVSIDRDVLGIFDFIGCVVNELTLRSEVNAIVKGNASIEGMAYAEGDWSGVTPEYIPNTVKPFFFYNAKYIVDEAEEDEKLVDSFELTLNNNYATDKYGNKQGRAAFPRAGKREVTGTLTLPDVKDVSYFTKYLANTPAKLEITIVGQAIDESNDFEMKITLPRIFYTGPTNPGAGGADVASLDVPFRAVLDTENEENEFKIELINDVPNLLTI